jgi:hypothetical protein
MRAPLAAAVLLGLAACGPREELVGGRPRSYWLKECSRTSFLSFWNSDDDERRRRAFTELEAIGEPAVPILVELLKRNHVPESGDALNTLGALGPRASSAVPELAGLLGDPRFTARVALILARMGPAAAPALPHLEQALRSGPAEVRRVCGDALLAIGPAGLDVLQKAAAASDPAMREAAYATLAGARRADAVREALGDPLPQVRAAAVASWNARREDAAAGVTDLVRALNDPDPAVRASARQTYTRWSQHQALTPDVVMAVLAGGDVETRRQAAWWLGVRGPEPLSATAASALRRALDDPDPTVRVYAIRSLLSDRRVPVARDARLVAVLESTLAEVRDDVALRLYLAESLLVLTGRTDEAVAAVQQAAAHGDRFQKWQAIALAREVAARGGDVAQVLEELARDPDLEVRGRAARALGRER